MTVWMVQMANSGQIQQMLKTILIWSSTIVIPASVIPKLELFSNEIRSVLVCAGIKQAKYEWSIFDQMLCIFNVSRIELHTEHEKLKIWRLNNCNFMLNWRLLLTPRPATPLTQTHQSQICWNCSWSVHINQGVHARLCGAAWLYWQPHTRLYLCGSTAAVSPLSRTEEKPSPRLARYGGVAAL